MTFSECFNDISPKQILYINAPNDEQRKHFNIILLKCMKQGWYLFLLQDNTPLIYKLVLLGIICCFMLKDMKHK